MLPTTPAPWPIGPSPGERQRFLDLLRAVAAQLIVWHHLAFYGPLSDRAWPLPPRLFSWLHAHGRMAVQIFLVVGGFVAAQHLGRLGHVRWRDVGLEISRRYRRVGGPCLVVLAFAVCANALADHWIEHRSISAPPTVAQVLAHLACAQDVLGFEALSAGLWYLSVDLWSISARLPSACSSSTSPPASWSAPG